jgi:hypothetical protein
MTGWLRMKEDEDDVATPPHSLEFESFPAASELSAQNKKQKIKK